MTQPWDVSSFGTIFSHSFVKTPTLLKKLIVFYVLLAIHLQGWTYQDQSQGDDSIDLEMVLSQMDFFKSKNLDSLVSLHEMVIASGNERYQKQANIKFAEGLILFNFFDRADSLLVNLDTTDLAFTDRISYLIATGKVLNHSDRNEEALEVFYGALKEMSSETATGKSAELYLEIANVLRENNDLENCTRYFRKAHLQAQKDGNVTLQVKAFVQLCKVYNGWVTVNIDSSVYYGEQAIAIAQASNDEYSYVDAIAIAAAPIIRQGQHRRGIQMSREALSFADKYNLSLKQRYYLVANQGFAFEGLKIYDSALHYMQKANTLRPESLDFLRLKYRILKSQGEFQEALEVYEEYKEKQVSVIESRNSSSLSSVQARYEANLKEQEVESLREFTNLQEAKLTQQKYLLVSMVVILLFLLGGGFLLVSQRRLKEKQRITNLELEEIKKRLKLEKQYRAAELKALRSQMNPHFVFNALNSIQEYIITNEKKLAGKYLGKFADLMRIYLNHSQAKTVTISEEIEAISLYLELEKLRFENSLTYDISISEEVDQTALIPSFLAQPYVENAIKHGLFHKPTNRRLSVLLEMASEDTLVYTIEDNGVGRQKSREINSLRQDHKSFAISATRTRLELLNKERAKPIIERVDDLTDEDGRPTGTRVVISIPLELIA